MPVIKKIKKIKNVNGDIVKYLGSSVKKKFVEIYFSEIKYKKFKGWNMHINLKCYLSVPKGKVQFFIHNKNTKKIKTIIINSKNPKLLTVEKKTWFKFTSLEKPFSIVVNSLEKYHSKKEVKKLDCFQYKYPE